MYLENLVFDALEPRLLGQFWEAALGCERLTDEADIVESRLDLGEDRYLDLCFPRVPALPSGPPRLHLVLGSGSRPGPHDADPEGNAYRVLESGSGHADSRPLATVSLESADPARDAAFWAWLTGWSAVDGAGSPTLHHVSRRGPVLELCSERGPKGPGKNRVHLDVRLEAGEELDAAEPEILERGGRRVSPDGAGFPWRTYQDPSGNEFCLLPAPA